MNQTNQTGNDAAKSQAHMVHMGVSRGRFSPGYYGANNSHFLLLEHDADEVVFTPVPCEGASVTLAGVKLASGQPSAPVKITDNRMVLPLTVTSADGTSTRNYTITVYRDLPTPKWKQVSETNPWCPRDSAGELVFGGYMWLIGGYTPDLVNDVWRTRDGKNWERMPDVPDASGFNIPFAFVFAGHMWVTSVAGNYWRTIDGKTWEQITAPTPWKGRVNAGVLVFKDRVWIMGGVQDGIIKNDVWSSADGLSWRQETSSAPWSRRHLHDNVLAYNNRMWVIGGGIQSYHPFKTYRDVWSSTDGVHWEKATDCAPWEGRIWASTTVYRGRMWLFAGFRCEPVRENRSDIWHSTDGKNWEQLVTPPAWKPRHEVSHYVYDGKLWIMGGMGWPLISDTWCLDIPGLTFTTSPALEEYSQAEYTYRAHATFNNSATPVRYRLVKAPAWLKLVDENTGVIRGTPDGLGESEIIIEAWDEAGETARQSFKLNVIK